MRYEITPLLRTLFPVAKLSIVPTMLAFLAVTAMGQDFSKSFKVVPNAGILKVITKAGSVLIVPGETSFIQVTSHKPSVAINTSQAQEGEIKVEVADNAPVDLVISVPVETAIDILCVKCTVTVKGLRGGIRVSTTEGDIRLTGIRSMSVEARSMSGNVSYSGEIAATGRYALRSFSGRVDAFLPAGSKFRLDATSAKGGIEIDPGEFQLNVERQTSQFVKGLTGGAGAMVELWTQDGTIRVKKR